MDQNIDVAQTQFWSLALQQQLARRGVEMSYSGAHGVHLYDLNNINQIGAAQAYLGDPFLRGAQCGNSGFTNLATGIPECFTRPNQQYSTITSVAVGVSIAITL